jgi:hypothetical protein
MYRKTGATAPTMPGDWPAIRRMTEMRPRRTLALAALAALAFPAAALAATQGTIPVSPGQWVRGGFAGPGTQTWDLRLESGRVYTVVGTTRDDYKTVVVRAMGGLVLARFVISWDDGAVSATFAAPYSGGYTVAVTTGTSCRPGHCGDYPHAYQLRATLHEPQESHENDG